MFFFVCLLFHSVCYCFFFLYLLPFLDFRRFTARPTHVYSACSLVKSHIYVTNIGYNFICFNHYLNAKNMAFRTLTILVFFIIIFLPWFGFPRTPSSLSRAHFFVCLFWRPFCFFFRRSLNEFSPRVGVDRPEPELTCEKGQTKVPSVRGPARIA